MKDYHKSALVETSLVLLFTVMPTIFTLIKMLISNDIIPHSKLYINGEFYLYSVSLIGSSFLIYNHYKTKKSDNYSITSFVCIILIILFSLAYTVLANTTNPKIDFVKISSIVAILISVVLFFVSQAINNKRSPDIGDQRRNEQKLIENALN